MTSLQDFPVIDDAPKDSSFGPTFFLQVVIFLMLFVILLPMVMILLSTVSRIKLLIYGNNLSGLLNLTFERGNVDWTGEWFVDFNTGKTQLALLDGS